MRQRRWEAWGACLAAAAVPLVAAPAARAHAVLVAVVPASAAVVQSSPPQLLLCFHGRIETSAGAVELLDSSGRPQTLGAIARPTVSTRPPRTDFFTTATRLGLLGLEVGVSPDAPGTNTIDLLVSDAAGRPVDLEGVFVTAAHRRSKRLRFRTEQLVHGHFVVDVARLPRPGVWRLRIGGRRGSLRLERTISVPVSS